MAYQKIKSHEEYLKIVEQYKDYRTGTYKAMSLKEKMDFFDGIHTDNVPLWDEDGDSMNTFDDYYSIEDEFLNCPEQFSLNDILTFLEMLDDSCYQPSFMDTITEIIHNIVQYYQLDGVLFLLSHLHEVPSKGYNWGLFVNIRRLIRDDKTYQLVKDAIGMVPTDTVRLIHRILSGKDMPEVLQINGKTGKFPIFDECGNETELKRKSEIEDIISRLFPISILDK